MTGVGGGLTDQTNNGAAARKFELQAEPGQIGINVAVPVRPLSY